MRPHHSRTFKVLALLVPPRGMGLYLRESASWRPRTIAKMNGPARSVAWSPDGKRVAFCGGGNGNVTVWGVGASRAAQVLAPRPGKMANGVAFSPDGKWIAASYSDSWNDMEGQVRLWDAQSGAPKRTWKGSRSHTGVAFSRDGKTLASSGYRNVALAKMPSGERAGQVSVGDTFWVKGVALSPDGQTIIGKGESGTFYLWDRHKAARKDYWVENIGDAPSDCAALSPNGKLLALGLTGRIELWDTDTRKRRAIRLAATVPGSIKALAWARDGQTLAGGYDTGDIEMWDMASRRSRRVLKSHAKSTTAITESITALDFSPDARTLASAGADGTVRLWRLK